MLVVAYAMAMPPIAARSSEDLATTVATGVHAAALLERGIHPHEDPIAYRGRAREASKSPGGVVCWSP
jgi:hypothetical protein